MARDSRIGIIVGLLMILACGLLVNEIINPNTSLEPAAAFEPDDPIVAAPTLHARPRGLVVSRHSQPAPVPTPAPEPQQIVYQIDPIQQAEAQPSGFNRGLIAYEQQAQPSPVPTPAPTPAPQPEPEVRRYHVVPGDTLSAIAAKVYGPGQEDEYWRLFEANRFQLNDPGDIHPGQMLVIPPLTDSADANDLHRINQPGQVRRPTTTPGVLETSDGRPIMAEMDAQQLRAHLASRQGTRPAPQPTPALSPRSIRQTTYVVRSGDTLTAIARREMGSGTQEAVNRLFEVNRSVLRDPNQLSVGMTLRIPEAP